jgi:hypothetical protein
MLSFTFSIECNHYMQRLTTQTTQKYLAQQEGVDVPVILYQLTIMLSFSSMQPLHVDAYINHTENPCATGSSRSGFTSQWYTNNIVCLYRKATFTHRSLHKIHSKFSQQWFLFLLLFCIDWSTGMDR